MMTIGDEAFLLEAVPVIVAGGLLIIWYFNLRGYEIE
jgi:hypothetical protein